jgi:hypothetical protein
VLFRSLRNLAARIAAFAKILFKVRVQLRRHILPSSWGGMPPLPLCWTIVQNVPAMQTGPLNNIAEARAGNALVCRPSIC